MLLGIKSVHSNLQSFSHYCSTGVQITTNYLNIQYNMSSYIDRINQMHYLLNAPMPMSILHAANTIMQRKENWFEVDHLTLEVGSKVFIFNNSNNLYQHIAGTKNEKGKYNVTKVRSEKFLKLMSFKSSVSNTTAVIQNQLQFNERLYNPTTNNSFQDLHYTTSTLHIVEVTQYNDISTIPYANAMYNASKSTTCVACSSEPQHFITLSCSCKDYSSSGFRCPEIVVVLHLLKLYNVSEALETLEPIRKKGRQ